MCGQHDIAARRVLRPAFCRHLAADRVLHTLVPNGIGSLYLGPGVSLVLGEVHVVVVIGGDSRPTLIGATECLPVVAGGGFAGVEKALRHRGSERRGSWFSHVIAVLQLSRADTHQ
jgi:hypothetical protein